MNKLLLIPVLAFAILLTGCGNQAADNSSKEEAKDDTNKETVVEKDSKDVEADKKIADTEAKEESKDAEKKDTSTSSAQEKAKATFSDSIEVTSFKADDTLVSPALIEGEADVKSGVVMVELRKADHSLTSDSVEALVTDGKFKVSKFWFEFKNTDEGFVAVYDKDNKENLVEIPVKFQTVK